MVPTGTEETICRLVREYSDIRRCAEKRNLPLEEAAQQAAPESEPDLCGDDPGEPGRHSAGHRQLPHGTVYAHAAGGRVTPWLVNSWTLNAAVSSMAQDGIVYYLLDIQSIEMFADRTVYMVFYQGTVPDRKTFTMAEDGAISFAEDVTGPHAMFTLPLDASKADPAAVEQFIADSGFDRDWFTTVRPDGGTSYTTRESENGKYVEILPES